jgi:transcriptional regulator with XRE-family HTH domain
MTIIESPLVARRRLRRALRRLREASSMTQGDVARQLEWSLSKVNRIEIGDVTVSTTDLQALLRLFKVADESEREALARQCRAARRRSWWDDPRYRTQLTPGTIELLQFQGDARKIYSFHSTLMPGIVQTREYAEQVLAFWADELSVQEREARLEVRMRWWSHVFDRPDPPECVLVLDEAIVSREVGGPKVMIEQLRALQRSGQEPNVEVRILPLSDAAFMAAYAPFIVVELGDNDAVLYRETHLADEVTDSPVVVERYQRFVAQVLSKSLGVDASARVIEARIAALAAALDRI